MQNTIYNNKKFSKNLLMRFQKLHWKKFGKLITDEDAMRELVFLTQIVKIFLLKELAEETDKNDGKN